ncbi:MAG: hypothetical protein V4646_07280 [Pseudomonadota bacterium]
MKNIWISALSENQPRVAAVTAVLKQYGLNCQGHFWTDAPEKMSWRAAMTGLQDAKADLWLVLADDAGMAKPGVRYALSLMAASLRQAKGAGFQIVLLWNSPAPAADKLPPLLQTATVVEEAAASWSAKIVARANMPGKAATPDYRLDIQGDERLGQWFEIGPREGSWPGVVLGVSGEGAEINFQAVGPKGRLPEKTTLEYAQQGLKIQAGSREFTAWAVRNQVDSDASYFARVKGCPEAILFMPYADDSDVSATVLGLQ